jgi:hypothetical protein
MGDPRGDADQGAVAAEEAFPDFPGRFFPGENSRTLESEQIFPVPGVEMVAPHLPRGNGNEMEGPQHILRSLNPRLTLPGEEDEPPGVFFYFLKEF